MGVRRVPILAFLFLCTISYCFFESVNASDSVPSNPSQDEVCVSQADFSASQARIVALEESIATTKRQSAEAVRLAEIAATSAEKRSEEIVLAKDRELQSALTKQAEANTAAAQCNGDLKKVLSEAQQHQAAVGVCESRATQIYTEIKSEASRCMEKLKVVESDVVGRKDSELEVCRASAVSANEQSSKLSQSLQACTAKAEERGSAFQQCETSKAALVGKSANLETKVASLESSLSKSEATVVSSKAQLDALERAAATLRKENARHERSLVQAKKDVADARKKMSDLQKDSYIYSYDQFRRSVNKFLILGSILVKNVAPKIPSLDQISIPANVEQYYTQVSLLTKEVVRQGQEKAAPILAKVAPHAAEVRKLYEQKAAGIVRQTSSQAIDLIFQGRDAAKVASVKAGQWTEANLINPLIVMEPSLNSLVPSGWTDRLFAAGFTTMVLVVLFRFFRTCCQFILYLLKLALSTLLCPVYCLCSRRKQVKAASTKSLKAKKGVPAAGKTSDKNDGGKSTAKDLTSPPTGGKERKFVPVKQEEQAHPKRK